jgi:hypothetical protein
LTAFIASNSQQCHLAGGTSMEQIDSLVQLEGAGSGGLLYLPYLNGSLLQLHDMVCLMDQDCVVCKVTVLEISKLVPGHQYLFITSRFNEQTALRSA